MEIQDLNTAKQELIKRLEKEITDFQDKHQLHIKVRHMKLIKKTHRTKHNLTIGERIEVKIEL